MEEDSEETTQDCSSSKDQQSHIDDVVMGEAETMADQSADLWQILHGAQEPHDGPNMMYMYVGSQRYIVKALDFGENDWNNVIQRGYSWAEFESFIEKWICVCVGPFWISRCWIQVHGVTRFLRMGKLCFSMDNRPTSDIKSLFLLLFSMFSLNPGKRRCSVFKPDWLSIILNEGIVLDHLTVIGHERIDAATLQLVAARTRGLDLCFCNMLSTQIIPSSMANQLQDLRLDDTQIDVDLLTSFIPMCTSLKVLGFDSSSERCYTFDQWMALMAACSVEEIRLRSFHVQTSAWLPGLALLIQHASSVCYDVRSFQTPTRQQHIDDASKAHRIKAAAQALKRNQNITSLDVHYLEMPCNDFEPILKCHELWKKKIAPFCCEMGSTHRDLQLLGRLLGHSLLHQNPSLLFELICKTNHMWHDGLRHGNAAAVAADSETSDPLQNGQRRKSTSITNECIGVDHKKQRRAID